MRLLELIKNLNRPQLGKDKVEMPNNLSGKIQIGFDGEKLASAYLSKLGFVITHDTPNVSLPYDILAIKDGISYAINVKTISQKKGAFTIHSGNVKRLFEYAKKNNVVISFLLVNSLYNTFALFELNSLYSIWASSEVKVPKPPSVPISALGASKLFTPPQVMALLNTGTKTLREIWTGIGCSKSTAEELVKKMETEMTIQKMNVRTDKNPLWMYSLVESK